MRNMSIRATVLGLLALLGLPLLAQTTAPELPTLYLIGDSTVRNGRGDGGNGQWGWGEPLGSYFDASKIRVLNRAHGGRSSRTYLTGDWESVLAALKPGDFVIMQFGHNDGGPLDDDQRARGTLRGIGDETREIDNPITKQHEVVHTFGWYLRKFIADTKSKGATPLVCSLVPRKIWKEGKIARNSSDYGGWAGEVARSESVAFLDLNEIIARRYDELGPEAVEPLFADPHTHTSRAGAEFNAASVVAALKGLKANPLAAYFSGKAEVVVPSLTVQAADKFTLDQLRFLCGRWVGRDASGETEEQWSPPANNTIMGMYREMSNGKTTFYEFFVISQEPDKLVLRMKHFDANLAGWEDKDKSLIFDVVSLSQNEVTFQSRDDAKPIKLAYTRTNDKQLDAILIHERGGKTLRDEFHYRLAQ
jgi:rhamnogalacturonan acetylesterase